jgi:hypothetical protein
LRTDAKVKRNFVLIPGAGGAHVSIGIGIVQPFVLLGVCRTFWMYSKVCLGASVVVAYTNDGYLRNAYR